MMKRNDGFTLVEMMVSIIAGTLATAAVATILLLGMRINAKTSEIATRDNQVMIGLTVLGNIAKESKDISTTGPDANGDWNVITSMDSDSDGNKDMLFSYSKENASISVASGAVLLENVTYSDVTWDETRRLLRIEIEIDEKETFQSTIYCPVQTIETP